MRWADAAGDGRETLRLARLADAWIEAAGVVAATSGEARFGLTYRLRCDAQWRVREVACSTSDGTALGLETDGQGRWTDAEGRALEALAGCLDVDLRATPFTNTLPIRRMNLPAGTAARIRVAYIDVPDLAVSAVEQSYACLAEGRVYRFEQDDFRADITVDRHGLVVDYPELFRRID